MIPLVEQAVFAHAPGGRPSNFKVVSASPGVKKEDAQALASWGPIQNYSLLQSCAATGSINFHPLPSGAYCISRTLPATYSDLDDSQRVETWCLIVPRPVLARFANNPFALLKAAVACGWEAQRQAGERISPHLKPLRVSGGAAAVDIALLRSLAQHINGDWMACLLQAARQATCAAVGGKPSSEQIMAGLLNCLPPECRLMFSFSTGLRYSPRRAYRWLSLPEDPTQRCWLAQFPQVVLLEPAADKTPPAMPWDGWSQFIRRVVESGRYDYLAAQLSKRRYQLVLDELPALGLQLLEEMERRELRNSSAEYSWEESKACAPSTTFSHAAHSLFSRRGLRPSSQHFSDDGAATGLTLDAPELLESLEQLDDLVYEAIDGEETSWTKLQTAWPKLAAQLTPEALAESREQYLRYVLTVWQECAENSGLRQAEMAMRAIEVLCLLLDERSWKNKN